MSLSTTDNSLCLHTQLLDHLKHDVIFTMKFLQSQYANITRVPVTCPFHDDTLKSNEWGLSVSFYSGILESFMRLLRYWWWIEKQESCPSISIDIQVQCLSSSSCRNNCRWHKGMTNSGRLLHSSIQQQLAVDLEPLIQVEQSGSRQFAGQCNPS